MQALFRQELCIPGFVEKADARTGARIRMHLLATASIDRVMRRSASDKATGYWEGVSAQHNVCPVRSETIQPEPTGLPPPPPPPSPIQPFTLTKRRAKLTLKGARLTASTLLLFAAILLAASMALSWWGASASGGGHATVLGFLPGADYRAQTGSNLSYPSYVSAGLVHVGQLYEAVLAVGVVATVAGARRHAVELPRRAQRLQDPKIPADHFPLRIHRLCRRRSPPRSRGGRATRGIQRGQHFRLRGRGLWREPESVHLLLEFDIDRGRDRELGGRCGMVSFGHRRGSSLGRAPHPLEQAKNAVTLGTRRPRIGPGEPRPHRPTECSSSSPVVF